MPGPPIIASWDLGKGESAVISGAYQDRDWEIVVDVGAARKCAQAMEIKYLGTVGIILRAKRQGIITETSPLLQALLTHGFRIAPIILMKAIELAGEA